MKLIYIMHRKLDKENYVPPHLHSCYELVYYYNGQGTTKFSPHKNVIDSKPTAWNFNLDKENISIDYTPNSFILYPPYYIHDEIQRADSETFSIGFELSEEMKNLKSCLFKSFDVCRLKQSEIFQKIIEECTAQKTNYEINVLAYTMQLLVSLVRSNTQDSEDKTLSIDYIISNLDGYFFLEFDIDQLARSAGYSSSHFRKLFFEKTGMSPKKYIIFKRIETAKLMLTNSDLKISEIATRCGYLNVYDFSSLFKKHTNLSPLQFRNRYKS